MFKILRNGSYLRLWLAQVISQMGDGLTGVLILFLVASKTNDPLLISFVILAQLLPSALFGIFMGPIVDRYSKRWVMVIADLYSAGIILLMIFAQDSAIYLIGLVFLQGFGKALFSPARSASIPLLVGKENIPEAVALSQSTYAAMNIIGPSISGIFLLLHQTSIILIVDACSFILSALMISTITKLSLKAETSIKKKEKYIGSLKSGVREVVGMPALRFLLILLIPVTLVLGIYNANLPAALLQEFKVPAAHFGFLEAIAGGGAILGAMCGPFLLRRVRPSVVLLSATGLIGLLIAVIYPLDQWRIDYGITSIYLWCLFIGIFNALINVPLSSLFIGITPAEFRGRGAALLQAVSNSFSIIGIILGGWIGGVYGVLLGCASSGIMLVIVVLAFPWFKGYRSLHKIGEKRKAIQGETAPV